MKTPPSIPEFRAMLAIKDVCHESSKNEGASETAVSKTGANRKISAKICVARMALDWSKCASVESVPGKVSGAWVFRGTRMPVSAVFENLEDGLTVAEIVEIYDGLTLEQVKAVLDFAAQSLAAPSYSR